MAQTAEWPAVKKTPTVKVPGESATGTVTIQKGKTGPVAETFEKSGWMLPATDEPTVNVNVSLGRRVGLPEYSDVRYSVSLTLPTKATNESIEIAHAYARDFCFEKMKELHSKLVG